MSRIGKLPIDIPAGVKVNFSHPRVEISGPKGTLNMNITDEVELKVEKNQILVLRKGETKKHRSIHGLTRTLVANMVTGVNKGFSKTLNVIGIGYRVIKDKNALMLHLGYSNPIRFNIPKGIDIEVNKNNDVIISGADKQFVGQIAADIRALRSVEPYKGKGIRYKGEFVRRKVGKTKAA